MGKVQCNHATRHKGHSLHAHDDWQGPLKLLALIVKKCTHSKGALLHLVNTYYFL